MNEIILLNIRFLLFICQLIFFLICQILSRWICSRIRADAWAWYSLLDSESVALEIRNRYFRNSHPNFFFSFLSHHLLFRQSPPRLVSSPRCRCVVSSVSCREILAAAHRYPLSPRPPRIHGVIYKSILPGGSLNYGISRVL